MQTYPGLDGVLIRADLDRAEALVEFSCDGGQTWGGTPFQTADCQHRADRLAALVDGWLESQA
jgi:hypothetical protein